MVERRLVRSVRVRLVVISSLIVFGTGAVALAGVYFGLSHDLRNQTITKYRLTGEAVQIGDRVFLLPRQVTAEQVQTVEAAFRQIVLDRTTAAMLLTLGVLFLASVLVGWFHAGRVLQPLAAMAKVARDIEARDLTRRLPVDDPDNELGQMATTFNAMLDRLERAFSQQQAFLAQTSHDLRTPLAVIRSNLDVVLEDPDAALDDWREAGVTVMRAAERMSAMVDGLLAAARFETGQEPVVEVSLVELAADLAAETEARAQIETRIDGDPKVMGSRAAIFRAAANLVENAIQAEAGPLTLAVGVDGEWVFLAVADRGPGFHPDLLRSSRGLGLAIAGRTAEAHGGRLDMVPRVGGGAVVVLFLPPVGVTPRLDPVPLRLAEM